jgi:hypothetical protein
MTGRIDRDPIDELRDADPQRTQSVSTARLARIRARVYREINVEEPQTRSDPPSWRRWAAAGAVAAGVLVLALVAWPRASAPPVAVASPSPAARPSPSTAPQIGLCVEAYSLETLPRRTIAFDGTVTSKSGDEVTFAVNSAYRGVAGPSITLTAQGMSGTSITSVGGPTLEVGGRYLVAGEDQFAWDCGFTQPFDEGVAADWARTFAAR